MPMEDVTGAGGGVSIEIDIHVEFQKCILHS